MSEDIKIKHGSLQELKNVSNNDGVIYFAKDDNFLNGKIYYDDPSGEGRINVSGVGYDISGQIVDEKTAGIGAEIFNDYRKRASEGTGGNIASGDYSHAEGCQTTAIGSYSHAEGYKTNTLGEASHAEGQYTTAIGDISHAEGAQTKSESNFSHAEGALTLAANNIEAEFLYSSELEELLWSTLTTGDCSHVEGINTLTTGKACHAEGRRTQAMGDCSHAEGFNTLAQGEASHIEGVSTNFAKLYIFNDDNTLKDNNDIIEAWEDNKFSLASEGSHVEGGDNLALELYSHAEGLQTRALGPASHTEGVLTKASGVYSHAEGAQASAEGEASHAEGSSLAKGDYSHSENASYALDNFSHAEGYNTIAGTLSTSIPLPNGSSINFDDITSDYPYSEDAVKKILDDLEADLGYIPNSVHAEGFLTAAKDSPGAHAEGMHTIATSMGGHSEGVCTKASGPACHTEGYYTVADGVTSHAEGFYTIASGNYSHAGGCGTKATGDNQTVIGKYNQPNTTDLFVIGNGNDSDNRSNAFSVHSSGRRINLNNEMGGMEVYKEGEGVGVTYLVIDSYNSEGARAGISIQNQGFQSNGYPQFNLYAPSTGLKNGAGATGTTAYANLGTNSRPWKNGIINHIKGVSADFSSYCYAPSWSIPSDRRLKNIIDTENFENYLEAYNNLNPVFYTYKNDKFNRKHIGFIAQDVEMELNKYNIDTDNSGFVSISDLEEPTKDLPDGKRYTLDYNELHGLHTLKNQQQDARIKELEDENKNLKTKLSSLETELIKIKTFLNINE